MGFFINFIMAIIPVKYNCHSILPCCQMLFWQTRRHCHFDCSESEQVCNWPTSFPSSVIVGFESYFWPRNIPWYLFVGRFSRFLFQCPVESISDFTPRAEPHSQPEHFNSQKEKPTIHYTESDDPVQSKQFHLKERIQSHHSNILEAWQDNTK